MNRRVVFSVFVTLLVVGAVLSIGAYAYNVGLAQGALQNAQIVVPEAGEGMAPIYPYYGAPFYRFGPGFGPGGFAYGLVSCLVPLLAIFLFVVFLNVMVRVAFGGVGRGVWGGHRSRLEEWHRRAHEGDAAPKPE